MIFLLTPLTIKTQPFGFSTKPIIAIFLQLYSLFHRECYPPISFLSLHKNVDKSVGKLHNLAYLSHLSTLFYPQMSFLVILCNLMTTLFFRRLKKKLHVQLSLLSYPSRHFPLRFGNRTLSNIF